MKPPKRKGDWVGLRVRTKRDLMNGYITVAAGTVCEVLRNYGGLELRSEPCSHCGVQVRMTKVPERAVEILG